MISFDEFDEDNRPCANDNGFSKIVDRAVNRRRFLKSSAAFGLSAFVVGGTSLAFAKSPASSKVLGFSAVPANTHDTVTVPEGYSWEILISWGDPLFSQGVAFNHETRGTGESQELAFGDNNDGMNFFPLSDDEGVMVVNNEYANRDIICPKGINTEDDVRKVKAGHGVSVFNVKYVDGRWSPQLDGQYNRRITADSPMEITGPARGHDLLKTRADPTATSCKGTWKTAVMVEPRGAPTLPAKRTSMATLRQQMRPINLPMSKNAMVWGEKIGATIGSSLTHVLIFPKSQMNVTVPGTWLKLIP